GDTFCPLCQQQRKLHRQRHRLILTAIVAELPVGCFGIEGYFQGKFRQAAFYITGGSSTVSGAYIPPVSLGFYHQVFLPQVDDGIAYRCVSMRVILHGLAYYIGYLVEAAVVHLLHGMEYT